MRDPSFAEDADPFSYVINAKDRSVMEMVHEALNANRVTLAFQPVIGAATGETVFHEGLVRLLDDTGHIIPAGQFMGVVEAQELGRQIDCAALRCGLGALARHPRLRLAINMSARSVGYPKWMQVLKRGLSRDDTVGERLILEISETSAMQVPELVKTFMADLQDKGITFALDDFGAGTTSFRHLKEFYFDIIKIDGGFVRGCDRDPDNQCILDALVTLGQKFDMFTVAEKVETKGEANFLASVGIDCMQGYYYGAPETRPSWYVPPGRMAG
ncbi:EAL domain-containing protein [Jannaschia aquimarina]|uniref:YfgF protein n=1 Tax=Jannaschia aquimarina TaxID=935700 RepID=A0A0D1CPG5_9RHOB|nr:EAL domain-containing protein [Jannaschia aquimarina]KIT16652.1 Cyclic di-GMP phosphodiesterase YfgF [Jannaschia aquimarina]SNS93279.1 EAL domain, c-di-GMP-specific phosphodiesterase class I (or its enzymatically inactive variant) [Jannaschia aquimarina]